MSNECMSMPPLKPCPLCGGVAEHWYASADGRNFSNVPGIVWGKELTHHVIRCKKCGVQTKQYATKKGCFKAWNRRAGESNEI